MKSPNSFPRNTSHQFALILNGLRGGSGKRQTKTKLPAPPVRTEPQSLGDLLNDKTIRVIYELQNRGSYANALGRQSGRNSVFCQLGSRKQNAARRRASNLVGNVPEIPKTKPRCPMCGGDVTAGSTYCATCTPLINRARMLEKSKARAHRNPWPDCRGPQVRHAD